MNNKITNNIFKFTIKKTTICKRKQILREKFLKLRKQIKSQSYQQKSKQICQYLKNSSYFQQASKILFFASQKTEVNLWPLIKETLVKSEKKVLLPRVNKNDTLQIFSINYLSDLEKGSFDILQPKKNCLKVKPKEIDLILLPSVCIDKFGNRIGYGKGFFDRFLLLTKALKIAPIFQCQLSEKFIPEKHDVKINLILTEKGWIKI